MRVASERNDGGVRYLFFSAVVLPIVLAVLAGSWFAWQMRRLSVAAGWVDGADQVIAQAGEAQRSVFDQQSALNAFLFTGSESFLDAYRRASPGEALDELEQLVAHEPAQAEETRALREAYGGWVRNAEEAIARPAQGRTAGAIRERRAVLDEVRARSAAVVAHAKSVRVARMRHLERQTWTTTLGAVTLLALLAVTASLSSRRQLRIIGALMQRERDALAQAQEALRAKDAFLANLSHELRTPLTPILGWVSIARSRRLQGEALERALASIERSARAEARIVDDVLDISRIAAGKLRIAPEPVDPAAFVGAAVEVVELSARARDITITTEIASPLPVILGDPMRLQQVVWNLLSNAVKFTPRGGRVEVRVEACRGGLRIRVHDNGEGLSASFLPHVFEYFRQADASLTRAHGGLGLGLAIVKHLVELHGGEVEAESPGPGRGATFTVKLPAARSAPHDGADQRRQAALDPAPRPVDERAPQVDDGEQRDPRVAGEVFPGAAVAVGDEPVRDAAAVERRHREEVEEEEQHVHRHPPHQEQLHAAPAPAEHPEAEDQPVDDGAAHGQDEVGDRPRRRREHDPGAHADVAAEAHRVDGDRLGPAEGDAEQRREQGAEEIGVHQGVEGQPPLPRGGVVSEPVGGPGVRPLVNAEREQEEDEVHQPLADPRVLGHAPMVADAARRAGPR
jgi:signal transduction histidine kinase